MPGLDQGEQAVKAELTRLTYNHLASTAPAFVLLSWLVCALLWDSASQTALILWASGLYVAIVAHWALTRAFKRRQPLDHEMPVWRRFSELSALVLGLIWGATAPLFLLPGELFNLVFITILLSGMGMAAVATSSAYIPSMLLFLSASLGWLIVTLALSSDPLAWRIMFLALLSLGVNLAYGLRVHRALAETLRLRFENQALVLQKEEQSRLLQASLQHRDQGIGIADAQGRMRLWNQRFYELLGLSADTRQQDLDRLLDEAAPGLRLVTGEAEEYTRPDARVVELLQGRMPDGGRVVTLSDITERRQCERSLQAARNSAEQANAAKARFLSAASHDLRQPIHALGLFFHALAEQVRSPATEPLIKPLEQTIGVIDKQLGALLDLSKLDAGVLQPNMAPLALGGVFQQLEEEFRPIAAEGGNRLRVRPCRYWVRSDASMLVRMLSNLLTNALTFTRDGQVLLAARVRGDQLCCAVYDTGPGILPEHQEEVFQEFQQVSNPHQNRNQGLGLGLAIVRRFGQLLEHEVSLASRPGRGSCFAIRLPLAQAPACVAPVASPGPGDELRGLRVLVLDDDLIVQTALAGLLGGWGCQVEVAGSLPEAEALLEKGPAPPQLLLVDYRLSGEATGADAIAQLHARLGQQVPAVIVTGDTSPERLGEAESKGYPLLHKPAKPAQLRSLLRHLAAQR